MRTTINIDDHILDRAKRVAKRSRLSLRETVNRALGIGLAKLDPRSRARPYGATTYHMGFPPALNLDKALPLASVLEDEEVVRKLQLMK